MPLKIVVTSVYVDDQEKALRFYTEALGFVKKQDVPVGDARTPAATSSRSPDRRSSARGRLSSPRSGARQSGDVLERCS
jgi:catechol 2,3-dioxygenase-like lactoylglutathione lyase family enzyme